MTKQITADKSNADLAFAALRRPQGASAAIVQQVAGWARKPTRFDLSSFAARRGFKLTERTAKKSGEAIFRFTA